MANAAGITSARLAACHCFMCQDREVRPRSVSPSGRLTTEWLSGQRFSGLHAEMQMRAWFFAQIWKRRNISKTNFQITSINICTYVREIKSWPNNFELKFGICNLHCSCSCIFIPNVRFAWPCPGATFAGGVAKDTRGQLFLFLHFALANFRCSLCPGTYLHLRFASAMRCFIAF